MAKFPQDFEQHAHPVLPGAVHYKLYDTDGNRLYSVVGGGMGLYGDGVTTFEMFCDTIGDVVLSYATADDINEYLEESQE